MIHNGNKFIEIARALKVVFLHTTAVPSVSINIDNMAIFPDRPANYISRSN